MGTHDAGLEAMTRSALLAVHTDPRSMGRPSEPDGCPGPSFVKGFPAGTASSIQSASSGGYYLWSYGRSYVNCRDDIGSWKDQ